MSIEVRHAWDVMGGEISEADFAESIKKLRSGFLFYQKNPNIWRTRMLMLGVALGIIIPTAIVFEVMVQSEIILQAIVTIALILVFCVIAVFIAAHDIKVNMTKLLIAEKHGWIFNPVSSIARLNLVQKKFPTLRRGGGTGIDDQFWGKADINSKPIDFWMALHHYTTKTGKNKISHTATLMAFRLPRMIEHPFYIREGLEVGFLNKQDIQLESIEFNKRFVVRHSDGEQTDAVEIMRVITPATQQKFIELAKKFGHFSADFSGEAVVFSIDTDWLTPFSVSAFGKFEVDPRDEQLMRDRMSMMFGFAGDMLKFVD